MNNQKTTKRSLVAAGLVMLLCVAMLVGTTFAWFTDSASTGVNKIQAGNLEVQLLMYDGENYVDISNDTRAIFGTGSIAQNNNAQTLWEPGKTQVAYLAIKNNGNLALKYKVVLDVTNVANDLYEVMEYAITPDATNTNPVTAWTSGSPVVVGTHPVSDDVSLPVGATHYFALSVHMKEEAGNTYQNGEVDFDLTVYATQDTVENDSFGNDYDAGADVELATSATINGQAYASLQEAYEAVQPTVSSVFGLGQEAFSASDADKCAKFDELFPDGKITWTIYGEQKLTDAYMLSFGRKASYFGARTLKEIEVVGGNSQATLDLTGTNGTFALPYNWWGDTVDNIKITFKGITFKGIESIPGTWATPEQETPYTFENCTFNGKVYGYHDYNINLTIKNCTFNAPENTQYALMLQSTTGINGKVTVDGCTFNGYTRGINLQRPNTDFVVTNNTIRSTVSEPDRGAIQLTDGKSFVVTGNKVDVNAGNAFWFHDAATNGNVTYTISNNDVKAPYIGYSGVTTFDVNTKITSSGNKFNSTDTTKCMKKGATVAEATNLTAIH